MTLDSRIPLMAAQPVAGVGNAIAAGFDEYHKAKNHQRQNALLGLQANNQAANQGRQNALLGIQQDQNNRANEQHQFQMDSAKGAMLHKAFKGLSGLDPASRMAQIELMKPSLSQFGFDDDDWDQLATDEGLNIATQHFSQFVPSDQGMTEFQRENLALQKRRLDMQESLTPFQERSLTVKEQKLENETNLDLQEKIEERKAFGKESGKTKAQTVMQLPQTIAGAEHTISTLDKVLNHPGLKGATGLNSRANPQNFIPGTDEFDFNVLMDQVKGKTFLQAYESLKGGGQITEIEGKKAEQAIARLNTAQSTEEFIAAIEELREVVVSGLERATNQAGASEDNQALEWAKSNPNDPRAQQILQLNGNQ